jgi:riboflavin transporter FmnP
MMHTIKVIAGGLVLLGICLLMGRWVGGPTTAVGLVNAVKVFVPLWLVAAGINMWMGVSKAGYSVAEEVPFFLVVFAVPTVVALLVVWRVTRG